MKDPAARECDVIAHGFKIALLVFLQHRSFWDLPTELYIFPK